MAKAIRDINKPKWRPSEGTGTPVLVRLQPEMLSELDDWRGGRDDEPSRAEAIRRLIELGLQKGKAKAKG